MGDHRGHDCFQVHEAEEKERLALQKLQQKVRFFVNFKWIESH